MDDKLRCRFEMFARLPEHQIRVASAHRHVTDWLKHVHDPYIAFSTGKDSTCVLALVREQAQNTPAIYLDADCSFPESDWLLDKTPNCQRFLTDEPFLDTLARYGFDAGPNLERATMQSTVWKPIKRLIAEYGFDGVAYGLRAEESRQRRLHVYSRGPIFQYRRDGLWACQPIWNWSYLDVWSYIVTHDLPYCHTYNRMWDMPIEDQRLSYWAGETKRRWGRWAWLKRNYPDLFNRFAERFPEVRCYV